MKSIPVLCVAFILTHKFYIAHTHTHTHYALIDESCEFSHSENVHRMNDDRSHLTNTEAGGHSHTVVTVSSVCMCVF